MAKFHIRTSIVVSSTTEEGLEPLFHSLDVQQPLCRCKQILTCPARFVFRVQSLNILYIFSFNLIFLHVTALSTQHKLRRSL